MIIRSRNLKTKHGFAHSKIAKCIGDVLATCKDEKNWKSRSDVSYKIEVDHIQDYIKTLKEIHASFNIDMLILGDYFDISQLMKENIEAMGQNGHENKKRLKIALVSQLNLKIRSISKIDVQNLNLVTEAIHIDNVNGGINQQHDAVIMHNLSSLSSSQGSPQPYTDINGTGSTVNPNENVDHMQLLEHETPGLGLGGGMASSDGGTKGGLPPRAILTTHMLNMAHEGDEIASNDDSLEHNNTTTQEGASTVGQATTDYVE